MSYDLDMPFAYGGPLGTAAFRSQLTDFVVNEELGLQLEGEGEHHYLHLEKRGVNTDWVAQKIARLAGVKAQDVGFCGLKDRHAVATQWFSIYLPKGGVSDWSMLNDDNVKVLETTLGKRKLRRGQHQSNRFTITLRELDCAQGPAALNERMGLMSAEGVPNYFGEQRFGRDGSNLVQAARWLEQGVPLSKMKDKGIIMSAARSHIFNVVLAERVRQANWNCALVGDREQPSGPLWGRGRSLVSQDTLALEEQALAQFGQWLAGLEHCGLSQERRSLVLLPQQVRWNLDGQDLTLQFSLAPGEFATAVLREVLRLDNRSV